jgi:hypothetical protein
MSGETARRLDDAWTRFLTGEVLGQDDRCRLTAALQGDDVLHRRLLHDLRLDGALKAAAQGEREGDGFVRAMRARIAALSHPRSAGERPGAPTRWRSRRVIGSLLGLGAVAALIVSALIWRGFAPTSRQASQVRPQVPAVPAVTQVLVTSVIGQVQRYGADGRVRAVGPGTSVEAGEWLATVGPAARVRTEHEDGTEVDLGGDAVATGLGLRPGRGRMFVARGRLRVALPPDGPIPGMEVASPHAVVTADGCFSLEVTADHTRIEVQRRRVRVQSTGLPGWTYVRAGQYALVRPGQSLLIQDVVPGRGR